MQIINAVEMLFRGEKKKIVYVVTVGALGNDVACYWREYSDSTYTGNNEVQFIASNGNKMSAHEFDQIRHLLLNGLIYDLPSNWYYRT